jgi:uncharacterized protein
VATSSRCPICSRPSASRQENRSFPFCSDRCRLLDLGKWFGGEYRVAGPLAGDGGAEPSGADDADGDA